MALGEGWSQCHLVRNQRRQGQKGNFARERNRGWSSQRPVHRVQCPWSSDHRKHRVNPILGVNSGAYRPVLTPSYSSTF